MKRGIIVFIFILTFIFLIAIDYDLINDDESGIYFSWYASPSNPIEYWAVKYYASDTCTLKTVTWGRWTKKNSSYTDSIFITGENAGFPDMSNIFYSSSATVATEAVDMIIKDTALTVNLIPGGNFWTVIEAATGINNSYFLSDQVGMGASYCSDDGILWFELTDGVDTGDLIIRMKVGGPIGMSLLINEEGYIIENEFADKIHQPMNILFGVNNLNISISERQYVEIMILDKLGRTVEVFDKGYLEKGEYSYNLNNNKMHSDMYFLIVKTGLDVYKSKLLKLK
ncbi:hypothetical protein KAU15_01260 [candidate division WOR-3 bacterium]|nr:hypothetical protein [candidate division WOR-3 bacterium]